MSAEDTEGRYITAERVETREASYTKTHEIIRGYVVFAPRFFLLQFRSS